MVRHNPSTPKLKTRKSTLGTSQQYRMDRMASYQQKTCGVVLEQSPSTSLSSSFSSFQSTTTNTSMVRKQQQQQQQRQKVKTRKSKEDRTMMLAASSSSMGSNDVRNSIIKEADSREDDGDQELSPSSKVCILGTIGEEEEEEEEENHNYTTVDGEDVNCDGKEEAPKRDAPPPSASTTPHDHKERKKKKRKNKSKNKNKNKEKESTSATTFAQKKNSKTQSKMMMMTKKKTEEEEYGERIELVAMKNSNNQSFVRILISTPKRRSKTINAKNEETLVKKKHQQRLHQIMQAVKQSIAKPTPTAVAILNNNNHFLKTTLTNTDINDLQLLCTSMNDIALDTVADSCSPVVAISTTGFDPLVPKSKRQRAAQEDAGSLPLRRKRAGLLSPSSSPQEEGRAVSQGKATTKDASAATGTSMKTSSKLGLFSRSKFTKKLKKKKSKQTPGERETDAMEHAIAAGALAAATAPTSTIEDAIKRNKKKMARSNTFDSSDYTQAFSDYSSYDSAYSGYTSSLSTSDGENDKTDNDNFYEENGGVIRQMMSTFSPASGATEQQIFRIPSTVSFYSTDDEGSYDDDDTEAMEHYVYEDTYRVFGMSNGKGKKKDARDLRMAVCSDLSYTDDESDSDYDSDSDSDASSVSYCVDMNERISYSPSSRHERKFTVYTV